MRAINACHQFIIKNTHTHLSLHHEGEPAHHFLFFRFNFSGGKYFPHLRDKNWINWNNAKFSLQIDFET